jgi:hypothetical protein
MTWLCLFGFLLYGRSRKFDQAVLDEAIAVVSNVGDTLHEIIEVAGGIEISGAHLREVIENLVPDLLPVLPKLLIDSLLLLLLHRITLWLRVCLPVRNFISINQCRAKRRGFVPRAVYEAAVTQVCNRGATTLAAVTSSVNTITCGKPVEGLGNRWGARVSLQLLGICASRRTFAAHALGRTGSIVIGGTWYSIIHTQHELLPVVLAELTGY